MKYGVAVSVIEAGYVEVEAECLQEAKDIAEQMALNGDVLFHDIEPHETKIEAFLYSGLEPDEDDGEVNWIKEILSSEEK